MKRLFLSIIAIVAIAALTCSLDAKTKAQEAYVKKVRQIYNTAVQLSKNEYTGHTHCVSNHILPGSGPQEVKFDFYYGIEGPNDVSDNTRIEHVVFIRLSYNFADPQFYEEYLFDDNGKFIFFFKSADSYDEPNTKEEFRFYYKPDGSLVYANQKTVTNGKTVRDVDLKGGGQLADEAPANAKKYVDALKGLFLI